MGIVRYRVTKFEEQEIEIPEVRYATGAKKGQIRTPAHKEVSCREVFDRFEYGIEDAKGQETASLGYRFNTFSLALAFYSWQFHGGKITKELTQWLEEVNRKEEEKANRLRENARKAATKK